MTNRQSHKANLQATLALRARLGAGAGRAAAAAREGEATVGIRFSVVVPDGASGREACALT